MVGTVKKRGQEHDRSAFVGSCHALFLGINEGRSLFLFVYVIMI
ncbi:hypothetical protein D932_01219 [Enterococcus casseliflavus 14-MB-W-14]|nr:hypothetical protein D932_01219 [Enterococcus casseliflavus 14-MB-W-14]